MSFIVLRIIELTAQNKLSRLRLVSGGGFEKPLVLNLLPVIPSFV